MTTPIDPTFRMFVSMLCVLLSLGGHQASAIEPSRSNQSNNFGLPSEAIRLGTTLSLGNHEGIAAQIIDHIQRSDSALLARRFSKAMNQAQQAIETAHMSNDPLLIAAAGNQMGNVHSSRGDHAQALHHYDDALAAGQAASDNPTTLPIMINIVHAQLAQKRFFAAHAAHAQALAIALQTEPTTDTADRMMALGHLAQQLADLQPVEQAALIEPAYIAFSMALVIAEEQSDVIGKSYASGHLGKLYADQQRFAEAHRLLHRAIFFAEEADASDLLARWWWQLGRMHKAQQQIGEALSAYQQAITTLRPIQPMLVTGERGYPAAFWHITRQIYLEYASLLLTDSGQSSPNGGQARLRKIRNIMEDFKAVELQNHFRDYCVIRQREKNRTLRIDSLLPSGTATLYPVLFDNQLVVLLGLPNGQIKLSVIRIDAKRVRDTARRFRSSISPSSNPRRLRKHARQLYDWLIAPFEEHLAASAIHTLVTVPDDILRGIPFAALHDGRDYLVKRLAIAVSPGLLLTEPAQNGQHERRLLAAGLSDGVQGFSDLPHVDAEIAKIAAQYDGKQLLNEDFVEESLKEALAKVPYSIVSFSTHGRFDSDPSQSYVLTYNGKLSFNELEELIRVSDLRTQPVELIVLSACETGIGNERASLGLAGLAVKSGARSAMASLWSVSDESTADLVPDFLSKLRDPQLSKAQALQLAQHRLLSNQRTAHPFFWAPFILVGDWR